VCWRPPRAEGAARPGAPQRRTSATNRPTAVRPDPTAPRPKQSGAGYGRCPTSDESPLLDGRRPWKSVDRGLAASVVAVLMFLRWMTSKSDPSGRPMSAPSATAPSVTQVATTSSQTSLRPNESVVTTVNTTLAAPTTRPASSGRNESPLPMAEQLAFHEQLVAGARPRVIETLPKEVGAHVVRSVERLEFDRARPTIRLEATSPATSGAELREAAWIVTRWMLPFWDPAVVVRVPNAVPAFRLTLNRTEVECSANLMVELGYGAASRVQWAAECGGGFR
jgi:hypothetical protein